MSNPLTRLAGICLLVLAAGRICCAQPGDIQALGATGDGTTDDTDAVQVALDTGPSALYFSDGTYLLGSVTVPADTQITFAPRARLRINPQRIKDGALIEVVGDRVTLDGIDFDFTAQYQDGKPVAPLGVLIRAKDVGHLRFTRLRAVKPSAHVADVPITHAKALPDGGPAVIDLNGCHDVEIDRCQAYNVASVATATNCRRVSVHENKAEYTFHIIHFRDGSEWLRHYSNWSSHVNFQCWWWGGDANDTHAWMKGNTAELFLRDVKPGDEGYDKETVGAYDIFVHDNYAEYGVTMCWGSKGKNVLIDGNMARFMEDYAYGSEGGQRVVFSNNLAINGGNWGLAVYFWSESVLVTGNQILIRDEGEPRYRRNFMELHGPGKQGNFGAGKAHVSGNLFVNESRTPVVCGWSNEPWTGVSRDSAMRMLVIESCRDVNISDNKFVNGGIGTVEHSGRVLIANNDFEIDYPYEPRCVTLRAGMVEGIVRNNVFRRVPRLVVGADDGAKPAADAARGAAMAKEPAILALAMSGRSRVVEGNYIDGWARGIMCSADTTDEPARLIVRHNTLSGDIALVGPAAAFRKYVADNLDLNSLELIDPTPLEASPVISKLFDHDCAAGRPNHGRCGAHGPGCDMRRYKRTIGGVIEPILFPEPEKGD